MSGPIHGRATGGNDADGMKSKREENRHGHHDARTDYGDGG